MTDPTETDLSDVIERAVAETPLDELTSQAGVREAFELYEAAATAYTVATSFYSPVATATSSTNVANPTTAA